MPDIDSDDYFLLLSAEQLKSMTYAQAQAAFQSITFVSDEVRKECLAELEEARKNKYRIREV